MTSSAPLPEALEAAASPAAALAQARRVVVKIGSSLLFDAARRAVAADWLASLAVDIADLRRQGREAVVVSSGAVALGRGRLNLPTSRLQDKQAAAAVGQSLLMHAWEEALAPHGLMAGQVLLTRDDTERRRRWLNGRATLEALLAHGVIPVVNENDTVATEEIRYGDNDRLAARAAQLGRADLLILLSDVDGLYTADPRRDPNARHLPLIERLTPGVLAMASGANAQAGVGTGGMATKLAAAQIAASAGCATVIASGLTDHPLKAVSEGARASLILAPATPLAAWKQWIAGSMAPGGALTLDAGAVAAVSGDFGKGDSVRLVGPDGARIGVGLASYAAEEIALIRGRHSDAIESLLGYRGPSVVIHRDDLVLEDR